MALILEDGTGVDGANTYVSVEDVRAYAADRGVTMPVDDAAVAVHIYNGMDWFEMHDFPGVQTYEGAGLSFPRDGDEVIAALVVKVVCAAATTDVSIPLLPQYAGSADGSLKMKKLDVIEKEYYEGDYSSRLPQLTLLDGLIQPLLGGFGLGAGRLQTLRV